MELSLGGLSGPGWRVESPRAVLEIGAGAPVLRLSASALVADDGTELARDVAVTCRGATVSATFVACPSGSAALVVPPAEAPLRTTLGFVLRRADGHWRAEGVAGPGGGVRWTAARDAGGLRGSVLTDALPVEALRPWLPRLPGNVASLSGEITALDAEWRLPDDGALRVAGRLRGEGLGFDTKTGTVAAADLSGRAEMDWEATNEGWRGRLETVVEGGEILAGSFYTSLGGEPVSAAAEVSVSGVEWRLESLRYEDPGAVTLAGSALWRMAEPAGLRGLEANLKAQFPRFYGAYLQPVLAQYGFGDLVTTGTVDGEIRLAGGSPEALSLTVDGLDVSDTRGRLEFASLDGDIRWRAGGDALGSRLAWRSGRIYSIPLGAAEVRAEAVADDLSLERDTRLPVLDGALVINALEVADWFGERPELLLDASLEPISLTALSEALEWPPIQGTLAGRIPELTLREGVYRLGGSLVLDVFDGTVVVDNLRMERPFGVLPKLVADIRLEDLDLDKVTSIFTIGRITGRLDGRVDSLRLLDWTPVHFEAHLGTPGDDRSRHRISQRAVDTLANLGGGGASGAMSRGFLRFFDEFAYRRLGIGCRLENNVCLMEGAGPAPGGGYYIVEGAGVPRVDVIGHVRRVDWPVLLDQLIQTMQGTAPTVGDGS